MVVLRAHPVKSKTIKRIFQTGGKMGDQTTSLSAGGGKLQLGVTVGGGEFSRQKKVNERKWMKKNEQRTYREG